MTNQKNQDNHKPKYHMILVADGGSTKTDWRLLKEGREYKQIQTTGFNPYLIGSDVIESILWKELQPEIDSQGVSKLYYYGAGCSTPAKIQVVENAFEKVFPAAHLFIDHDLLGAARALCKNEAGIAVILGTGSNSCLYNGSTITDHIFSSGHFFGDEGSGARMGIKLIRDYLHNELPSDLLQVFQSEFAMSRENILDAVYNKPAPSRFLASFSTFIGNHREHAYIHNLISENFKQFYKYLVCCYKGFEDVPVHFAGSIAYHFQDYLETVGREFGIHFGCVIKAPIDGLVEYHLNEEA
jgi:N-acetylglucosamine kinase-like BadF-type ATPase